MSEPHWRTSNVKALAREIYDRKDYGSLPVLADALQEADFPDEELLAECRRPDLPRTKAARIVALAAGEETAQAAKDLVGYAQELGPGGYPGGLDELTVDELIEAAWRYADTGDDGLGDGSMNWSNATVEPDYQDFWRAWSIVTGVPVPEDVLRRRDSFFRCSC